MMLSCDAETMKPSEMALQIFLSMMTEPVKTFMKHLRSHADKYSDVSFKSR